MNLIIHGESPRIAFGLSRLGRRAPDALVIYNLDNPEGAAAWSGEVPAPQGYILKNEGSSYDIAGDAVGCMYGLFDLAHALENGSEPPLGTHAPRLAYRGIKLNIPLDARTPSYSDAGDSAWHNIPHMWEMEFWTELIDQLAQDKYNVVSLWNLHPFPSMVRVPGYERVGLDDVKRTREPVFGASLMGYGMYTQVYSQQLQTVKRLTMDQKIAFWREVMQYGWDRGVNFTVMTWNVFVYGTEGSGYGITDDMDNPVTQDYFRKSVCALLETYPLLAGIGVTAGERMSVGRVPDVDIAGDVRWLAETYGMGVADSLAGKDRPFHFIHRQHMSGAKEILAQFKEIPVPLEFSFKYSQAHLYSSEQPAFANNFFDSLPEGQKAWLTLRNDDMYMLRWGGVRFASAYLGGIPVRHVHGFMMGPDGYTLGRDYLSRKPGDPRPTVLERQWYRTAVWGRLAYEPNLNESHFTGLIGLRMGLDPERAGRLFELMERVSMVIPLINRVHWHDFDFQHYPEANCSSDKPRPALHLAGPVRFHDISDYLTAPAQPGTGHLSVAEVCALNKRGKPVPEGMVSPDEIVQRLNRSAEGALELLHEDWGDSPSELQAHLDDCRAMALLGRFFARKLECALTVQRVYDGTSKGGAEYAMQLGEDAHHAWLDYVDAVVPRYLPQRLTRMGGRMVDLKALCEQSREDMLTVREMMEPFVPMV